MPRRMASGPVHDLTFTLLPLRKRQTRCTRAQRTVSLAEAGFFCVFPARSAA
jgi:hypothetical protein